MKKTIFGAILFMTGVLACALLFAGALSLEWTVDGEFSVWWNLSRYGMMPVLIAFAVTAAAGLAIAVAGLLEKQR